VNDLLGRHLVDEREGLVELGLGGRLVTAVDSRADGLEAGAQRRTQFAIMRGPLDGLAVSLHRAFVSSRHSESSL
jgi:hypothetical protein